MVEILTKDKIDSCGIVFDDYATCKFEPGQQINGRLEFTLGTPILISGIQFEVEGEAKTSFSKHSGNESYLSLTFYVVGAENSFSKILTKGSYSYSFTFMLPSDIPSTYVGKFGCVRYTITTSFMENVRMFQSTVIKNKPVTYEFEFVVVNPLDLNTKPQLQNMETRELDVDEITNCWRCYAGAFRMVASIPCSGFAYKQVIPITIEVFNRTKFKIKRLKISLSMVEIFYADTPTRETKSVETDAYVRYTKSIRAKSSDVFEEWIPVPKHVPQSKLANCRIIDINHLLKVAAEFGGNLKVSSLIFVVTIGSIPIEAKLQLLEEKMQTVGSGVPLRTAGVYPSPYSFPTPNDEKPSPCRKIYSDVYPNMPFSYSKPVPYPTAVHPTSTAGCDRLPPSNTAAPVLFRLPSSHSGGSHSPDASPTPPSPVSSTQSPEAK